MTTAEKRDRLYKLAIRDTHLSEWAGIARDISHLNAAELNQTLALFEDTEKFAAQIERSIARDRRIAERFSR